MESDQRLPDGFIIQSETRSYRIEKVLGQGGFGITYLASFEEEKEQEVEIINKISGNIGEIRKKEIRVVKFKDTYHVAVKEFFMKENCSRDGSTGLVSFSNSNIREILDAYKEKARKEAQILSRFNHPNIVPVLEIFEANNTVYSVMDFVDGTDIRAFINRNGKIEQDKVLKYSLQICSALKEVHGKRILHLDIKPSNIMIDSNDNAKLMDFGISKQYNSSGEATSSTPVAKSAGYAPIEQYSSTTSGVLQRFHPQTDIYSLGATIYAMLTGEQPLEATLRYHEKIKSPVEANPLVERQINDVVLKAMSMAISDRYQTAEAMEKALETITGLDRNGETAIDDPAGEELLWNEALYPSGKHIAEAKKRIAELSNKKKINLKPLFIAAGCVAAIFILFMAIGLFSGKPDNKAEYYEYVQKGDSESNRGNHEAALDAYTSALDIDNSDNGLKSKINSEKKTLFEYYALRAKEAYAINDPAYYPVVLSDCKKALSYMDSEEIKIIKREVESKMTSPNLYIKRK
jgi:serine/threonine protein kinase